MKSLILFIGPTCSGKGTRCDECRQEGYVTLSSSKLLEEAGYKPETGQIKISDEEVHRIVMNKLKSLGKNSKVILEGFPRSVKQAEMLIKSFQIDQVIYFEITREVALKRMKNRNTCPTCRKSYSKTYRPPVVDGICDRCGTELIVRTSDTTRKCKNRYDNFQKNIHPIIECFSNNGICVKTVNADLDFDIISIIENGLA